MTELIGQMTLPFGNSEIPEGCTCTWSWGPPEFRWERIGPKEDGPWHQLADQVARIAAEGWKL